MTFGGVSDILKFTLRIECSILRIHSLLGIVKAILLLSLNFTISSPSSFQHLPLLTSFYTRKSQQIVMSSAPQSSWNHAAAFIAVGPEVARIFHAMMQPQTEQQTPFSVGVIYLIREHKDTWDYRRHVAGSPGQNYIRHIHRDIYMGRVPFTPWTTPSIDDLAAVIESLVGDAGNDMLHSVLREQDSV